LLAALPATADDMLDPVATSAMMQAGHDGLDSLHRLVMDLHKQLNALQAALAEETLDGAAAYGLAETDRPMVAALSPSMANAITDQIAACVYWPPFSRIPGG